MFCLSITPPLTDARCEGQGRESSQEFPASSRSSIPSMRSARPHRACIRLITTRPRRRGPLRSASAGFSNCSTRSTRRRFLTAISTTMPRTNSGVGRGNCTAPAAQADHAPAALQGLKGGVDLSPRGAADVTIKPLVPKLGPLQSCSRYSTQSGTCIQTAPNATSRYLRKTRNRCRGGFQLTQKAPNRGALAGVRVQWARMQFQTICRCRIAAQRPPRLPPRYTLVGSGRNKPEI